MIVRAGCLYRYVERACHIYRPFAREEPGGAGAEECTQVCHAIVTRNPVYGGEGGKKAGPRIICAFALAIRADNA